jgi:hypothetical protein
MTAMHLFWLASIAGALSFFTAGAAMVALRRRPVAAPPRRDDRELDALRAQLARAEAVSHEVEALRARADGSQVASHALERLHRELGTAEEKSRHLANVVDRSRSDVLAAARDLEQAHARVRELEAQLADRTQAMRDLSTKHEQLMGRISDAEGLRADYVRLRTTATESEFLKGEVARLEEALQQSKIAALGAANTNRPPLRAARGSVRIPSVPGRPIGESLATVMDRFADSGTRSIAIADTLGFPLASNGEDGLALAAYAALLIESANRAKQFLPVGRTSAIEIIDEHGARISVWTFDVEPDQLLLADLAVSPADPGRVDIALADLTTILAPTPTAIGRYTEGRSRQ